MYIFSESRYIGCKKFSIDSFYFVISIVENLTGSRQIASEVALRAIERAISDEGDALTETELLLLAEEVTEEFRDGEVSK